MTHRLLQNKLSHINLIWLAAYLVIVIGIVIGLLAVRDWALKTYGPEEANWQEWRAETEKLAKGEGPVLRRAAKSAKPPAIVLMKDYFAVCLVGAIVICSALFATLMFMIRGIFRPSTLPFNSEQNSTAAKESPGNAGCRSDSH